MRWIRVLGLVILLPQAVRGGEPSPAGLWATIDDRSGAARALVRIHARDARLTGLIERLFPRSGEGPDPVCERCRGERRGQRVVGMTIVWGHRPEGTRWVDGRILDPESGKEYSSSLWLEGVDTLRVRGRWGPFHRTQTWRRVVAGRTIQGGQ